MHGLATVPELLPCLVHQVSVIADTIQVMGAYVALFGCIQTRVFLLHCACLSWSELIHVLASLVLHMAGSLKEPFDPTACME